MTQALQGRSLQSLIVGFLGLAKLILDANHITVITDAQINEFATGVCAAAAVLGVWWTHLKSTPVASDTPTVTTKIVPINTPAPAALVTPVQAPVEAPQANPAPEAQNAPQA